MTTTNDHMDAGQNDGGATPTGSRSETLRVRGEALAAQVKTLLHEGNVRRIVVKNSEGHTVMEIPVTAGLVAAIIAPALTAVAALAAVASDWQIDVIRDGASPHTT